MRIGLAHGRIGKTSQSVTIKKTHVQFTRGRRETVKIVQGNHEHKNHCIPISFPPTLNLMYLCVSPFFVSSLANHNDDNVFKKYKLNCRIVTQVYSLR